MVLEAKKLCAIGCYYLVACTYVTPHDAPALQQGQGPFSNPMQLTSVQHDILAILQQHESSVHGQCR